MAAKKLLLFSHCLVTKGFSRSAIIDLQRSKIHLIPNSLAELLIDGRYLDIESGTSNYTKDELNIFNEYCEMLIELELAFIIENEEELKSFPKISMEWLFPSHISNCLLDTTSEFDYLNEDFLAQLERLCCNFIQLRFFSTTTFFHLNSLMDLISHSQIKAVEIIIPELKVPGFYSDLVSFVKNYKKISNLTVFGADDNCVFKEGINGMGYIMKASENNIDKTHCGIIDPSLFTTNISTYTESISFNSCLNKKVSVDLNGNIKNCPSMVESFGNIRNTSLEEAIKKPGFTKYWHIKKDEINKCKECEFRHVCTDCRAYIDQPEDIFSPPLKCGYDPRTNVWEDWSTNPIKKRAIDFYKIATT